MKDVKCIKMQIYIYNHRLYLYNLDYLDIHVHRCIFLQYMLDACRATWLRLNCRAPQAEVYGKVVNFHDIHKIPVLVICLKDMSII